MLEEKHQQCTIHHHVRVAIIEENATQHRIVDGEIVESYNSYEREPTDKIDAWCEDCHSVFYYEHYQDAPKWLQHLYDLAYKHDYGVEHIYTAQ